MKYTLSSIGQASPATFLFFLPARVPARVPSRVPSRVPPSFPPAFPPTFPPSVVGPPAGVSPPVDPERITVLTICQLWGFLTSKKRG